MGPAALSAAGAAFLIALVLTPAVRRLARISGFLDRSELWRKTHRAAIPRAGGVAVLAAYLAVSLALPVIFGAPLPSLRWIPGVAIVFVTGLADDRWNLRPRDKLAGVIAGAVCLYFAGVRVEIAHFAPWLGFCVTVAWLALCANAFNLIDGSDGVAAGVGISVSLASAAAALFAGDAGLALTAAPLAGALLGFLRYNFPPASIFLGDSGSLTVGILLGACTAMWSRGSASLSAAAGPLLALALPLVEVGLSIGRRFLRNQPIFQADRGHIHHRLLDRGFSPAAVALLLSAAAAGGAVLALLGRPGALSTAVLFAAAVWAGVRYLGYTEFRAAGRFLRTWFRPLVGAHLTVETLERTLRSAADVDACWRAIDAAGQSLGYGRIEGRLRGLRFVSGPADRPQAWQMRVNLPGGDYVNVTQFSGAFERPGMLAAFVGVVRVVLPDVLEMLPREARWPARANSRLIAVSGD